MMTRLTFLSCAAAVYLILIGAYGASAQNLFAPVVRVNDDVVTEYEVQQRLRFMQMLNAPNTTRESVIEALIDDRLRTAAAATIGIELTEEGLAAGLSDFAARADLTTEEFVKILGQAGVDVETYRDFIENSLVWRAFVRGRFNGSVEITEADIDRALADGGSGTGMRVLVSEIIIPAPPQEAARVRALAERIAQSQSAAEFSGYARQYSATASRDAGGRLPWQDIEKLPPALRPILLALAPGEVSAPLPIPNAVALFQLRAIEETGKPSLSYAEIEYAAYFMAGGRSDATLAQAAKLRGEVDQCDDLYAIAKDQPEDVLVHETKAPGEVPRDYAIELSKLDPGEVSTALTGNGGETLVFLMLCNRVAERNAEVDRDAVRSALRQNILQGHSARFVQQLRADARIIRK
mgnify:CR=1 FL=1|tara:strand:+ start:814 stop:2037 length:1224 start_codon:yes stop_codon:yes gene_type:complete